MELIVDRKWKKQSYTISNLTIDGKWFCNVLEDADRGLDDSMSIAKIRELKKPSAKVVLVSEFIAGSNLDSKYQGLEASKAVAEKLRIPLIDVASRLYYTPLNKNLYLNSDNVHPKQATHDRIANMLASEFLDIN